jgi:hypothetical protein
MGKAGTKIDLSGTHLPVLSRLLVVTAGAVLELGAGYNSTPLLHWTCKAEDRFFRSYENDRAWCEKMGDFTQYIEDWDKAPIDDVAWSIALIDHRPALRRHKDAIRLRNNAQFVVIHDTEPEIDKFYAYRRVWKHFRYRFDFDMIKPFTSVVSNYEDPRIYFNLT